MATSTEIKQRANALAGKTDVNSITPKEVGGIMYDLASHSENVLRNGGTLGIRKVYESVSAMEADSTNPVDLWGNPIKKGNLVVIYDGTTTGVDNNKIYAFMNPGWELATHLDAGYATKAETDAKLAELGSEVDFLKFVPELYLDGLDENNQYYLLIRHYVDGDYAADQIYIYKDSVETGNVVCVIEDNNISSGIVKFSESNNSGVTGYCLKAIVGEGVEVVMPVNVKDVTNIDNSPSIKTYLSEPRMYDYIDNSIGNSAYYFQRGNYEKSNAACIKELYLVGLDETKRYYMNRCGVHQVDDGLPFDQIYISEYTKDDKSDSKVVLTLEDYNRSTGICRFSKYNNSRLDGYVIKNFDTSVANVSNKTPDIIVSVVSSVSYSPTILSTFESDKIKESDSIRLRNDFIKGLIYVEKEHIIYEGNGNYVYSEGSAYCATPLYYPVKSGDRFTIYALCESNASYSLYDKDKKFTKAGQLSTDGTSIEITEDGYFRFSYNASKTPNPRIVFEGEGENVFVVKDDNIKNHSIGEEKLDKKFTERVGYIKSNIATIQGYVNSKGLVNVTESYKCTDFIKLSDIYNIDNGLVINTGFIAYNNNYSIPAVAFYDDERTLISVYSPQSPITGRLYGLDKEIIPNNATYIRINTSATSSPILNIEGYGLYTLQEKVEELEKEVLAFDVAKGKLVSDGTYNDELLCSPIINSESDYYVGYDRLSVNSKDGVCNIDNIVAISHDDLSASDYIGSRKIYNKYGFNGNFSMIVRPFKTIKEKEERIENIRKMVNDGNEVGLHVVGEHSYWWRNKFFDVRPNGTNTFAPSVSDLQGSNSDKTGINAFGTTITSSSKLSQMGYSSFPSTVVDELVINLTEANLRLLNSFYAIYSEPTLFVGLDLNDIEKSKTAIHWAEYWYNELVDNTLGYSSESSDVTSKFEEDYEYPLGADINEYYPNAEHLVEGKIVFYDDINNPNYSNSEYQKVGRFKKGIFKGCASCCNYEAVDRYIVAAKAFLKHYYGIDRFTTFGVHGHRYFQKSYINSSNHFEYEDRGFNILANESGLMYFSRSGKWRTMFDLLLANGIRTTNTIKPHNPVLEGQVGLYRGQKDFRSDFFHRPNFKNYIDSFGNGVNTYMSYNDFSAFIDGQDDWAKFLYENAGRTITRNGKTFEVYSYFKNAVDTIRACKGTGKIPVFTCDTIGLTPSVPLALDLFLRYCYVNNLKVVPLEKARMIATTSECGFKSNYFPNPSMTQSLLMQFGGSSTQKSAYIPEGWLLEWGDLSSVDIQDDSNGEKKMILHSSSEGELYTKIYGLPVGKYKLSFYGLKENGNARVSVYQKLNGDYVNSSYDKDNKTMILQKWLDGNYGVNEVEFEVKEPIRNMISRGDEVSQICMGYESNFSNVTVRVYFGANANFTLGSFSLKKIE